MKNSPKSLTKQTLKIFWEHSKPWKYSILGIAFFGILADAIFSILPWSYKLLLDLLAKNNINSRTQPLRILVVIFGLLVLQKIFFICRDWINQDFQAGVKQSLFNTCFVAIHKQSLGFINNQFVGSLIKKVSRFDRSFENLADEAVFGLGSTILQALFIVVSLFLLNYKFALGFLLCFSLYTIFILFALHFKKPIDLARATADTKNTGHLADTATNFFTIKSFSSQAKEARTMFELSEALRRLILKSWQATWWINVGTDIFFVVLEVSIMYWAIKLWGRGQMTVGSITLLQIYIARITSKLWSLGGQIKNISESLSDANEMTEILLKEPGVIDIPNAKALKVKEGAIEFKEVSFGYADANTTHSSVTPEATSAAESSRQARAVRGPEPENEKQHHILSSFSLSILPKEKIALVGPSGGGKSTLTKLLFRFYDVNQGKILIDKQDISKITQESLRQAMSLVPQEPVLFHRSIFENISYGKVNATEEEVVAASKLAHCHEFIEKLENKYQTLVGERGVKLSGGERQRVAIARAILKDAPILVLDEATSSLDSESESLIQDALKNLMKDKTVIVIAHRLSTIMQMDRIVVIEAGTITEQGKHQELIKAKQGTYQRLWEIQAGGY